MPCLSSFSSPYSKPQLNRSMASSRRSTSFRPSGRSSGRLSAWAATAPWWGGSPDLPFKPFTEQPRQIPDVVDMGMGEQHVVNGRRRHRPGLHGHSPIISLHGAAIHQDIEPLRLHQVTRPRHAGLSAQVRQSVSRSWHHQSPGGVRKPLSQAAEIKPEHPRSFADVLRSLMPAISGWFRSWGTIVHDLSLW